MKKKFTTTIDEDVIKQAKIQAIEENTSVAELIERIPWNGISRSFFISPKIPSAYLLLKPCSLPRLQFPSIPHVL